MKNKHKNTIKVIIVVALLVKGLFSIQNVKAEWTPDEQHLTGVEAHNLNNKKLKNATKADYEKLQKMAKQPGTHYLKKPLAVYLFPLNNDSKGNPEIYNFQDNGNGQYVKGERDSEITNISLLIESPNRIIGTANINGQGYLIEHELNYFKQYLISTEYIKLPYEGYTVKKHKKIIFYDKNGERSKEKKKLIKNRNVDSNNFVATKDSQLINGKKYRRIYAMSYYGTGVYLHVYFIKNSDFKKLKPAKVSLEWNGKWTKSKNKKSFTNYKPMGKYVDTSHWTEYEKDDDIDPKKYDKGLIDGINADYLGKDFDWTKVGD